SRLLLDYTRRVSDAGRDLPQRAISALIWIAAFSFATGIFLASTLLLRALPPTAHVAVGRVTIENASKARDYVIAALFCLIVPVRTLFLEIVFVLFFLLLIWIVFVFVARLASLLIEIDFVTALQRLAVAGLPLTILPLLGLAFIPAAVAISAAMIALLIGVAFALRGGEIEPPRRVRAIVAYAAIPLLLYCFSYASTANVTQWL